MRQSSGLGRLTLNAAKGTDASVPFGIRRFGDVLLLEDDCFARIKTGEDLRTGAVGDAIQVGWGFHFFGEVEKEMLRRQFAHGVFSIDHRRGDPLHRLRKRAIGAVAEGKYDVEIPSTVGSDAFASVIVTRCR